MTPERWQHAKELFRSALEHAVEEREAFVERACDGDDGLRREVESLLASFEESDHFIETPVAEAAAELLTGDQAESMVGRRLGHYDVCALLGEGGMGTVYLAQDAKLGRKVALKLLPTYFTGDEDRLRRFEQEARAASALNHPNIITIHEIGEIKGVHYLVTEFVDGETLRDRLTQSRMEVPVALEVIAQVASALAAAHEAGIVHRDIKPENLMLRRDGLVKVLDFGLAKLTESQALTVETQAASAIKRVKTEAGVLMGTARYMSPEQARGQKVDPRSDIFSLGVVLYEVVTGRAPFEGTSASDVIASILIKEPPPLLRYLPEVPAELERIVTKSLEKDKEERYQVVNDLLLDLKRLKQQLEFEADQERSGRPNAIGEAPVKTSSGYAAVGTAKKSDPSTAELGAAHTTSSAEYLVSEIKRHPKGALLGFVALLTTLAAIGYWAWSDKGGQAIDSIAILPMTNAGGDINSEYLSDGITENIINSLSQLSGLKVTARTTVFRYKGKDVDAQAAGRELKVDAVMTGKVIQQGETLIVQADLVNVADGTQIWGDKYNRNISDILAVQEEIARRISEKLRLRLSGAEQRQLTKRYTDNNEAYQLYLRGRYHEDRRTVPNLEKATKYFQHAIALDPNYALAYAGLARTYASFNYLGAVPAKDVIPKAKEAVVRALEIDNQLAEAHATLGSLKSNYDWDWSGAERELKRALELNPNSDRVHSQYAFYLMRMGHFDEALAEIKRALELEPLSIRNNRDVGQILFYARRYDEAIEQCRKTLDLDPNFGTVYGWLAHSYEQKGMHEEAIAADLKERTLLGASPEAVAALKKAFAVSGRRGYWRKNLELTIEQAKQRYVSAYHIASIYARLGERDQAFAWLEKASEERNYWMTGLKVDPFWDSFRSDPRFTDLMRRVGFPQ